MFHIFHNWKTIRSQRCTLKYYRDSKFIQVNGVAVLQKCEDCQKERYYAESGFGREYLTLEYAKSVGLV